MTRKSVLAALLVTCVAVSLPVLSASAPDEVDREVELTPAPLVGDPVMVKEHSDAFVATRPSW